METPVENNFSDYYQAAERHGTKKEIDESDILNPDSEEPSRFEPRARDLTIPQVYWTEWAQNVRLFFVQRSQWSSTLIPFYLQKLLPL